jgi:transposase InsO family protein
MVMIQYKEMVPIRWLSHWTGLSRSSWYYTPKEGKRGIKPSKYTLKSNGQKVLNETIVKKIKAILSEEFLCCLGYEKICWELHDMGFIINKKKVYRLMKEAHLLNRLHRIKTHGRRKFVQTRKIEAFYPLQYLVMDIKYVWIQGEKRHAYLLTIMDVFTRKILAHACKPSIRQQDVVLLLDGIVQKHQTKGVIIRNDNGSQFLAHSVRKYLDSKGISQEFTHVATPEENGYIEALHSILEKELIRRYWFDTIHYARWKIADYYKTYNQKRKHRSLKRKTPDQVWNNYFETLKTEEKKLFICQTLLS